MSKSELDSAFARSCEVIDATKARTGNAKGTRASAYALILACSSMITTFATRKQRETAEQMNREVAQVLSLLARGDGIEWATIDTIANVIVDGMEIAKNMKD